MLYAVKGNKQLQIDETERDTYLKLGYDIATQEGNALEVVETSPSKTVSYKDHVKAIATIESLEVENAKLKAELAEAKKTAKADK
ncbi:hypothetical protein [Paenibacillus odorifer]|uniref:Uncharacterized protein n=1 Tax=Paenibacillus odorifer TaxID=189426 RepID=A0A1R0X945_9BACL|nr:hypothetical protein [Paenibacillus odorifer]OMD31363.1 hypothetical protein BJP51_19160 [Paenibacillus odorifer]